MVRPADVTVGAGLVGITPDEMLALVRGGPEAERLIELHGAGLLNPELVPPEPVRKRRRRKGCGCGKKKRRGE